jgi:hypothetical protein
VDLAGRRARAVHDARVHPAQVVPGAERRAVGKIVRAPGRAEADVVVVEVAVRRAARHRAAPAIPLEDGVVLRHPRLIPDGEEVHQHRVEGLGFRGGSPLVPLDAALHRGEHRAKQPRDIAGAPEEEAGGSFRRPDALLDASGVSTGSSVGMATAPALRFPRRWGTSFRAGGHRPSSAASESRSGAMPFAALTAGPSRGTADSTSAATASMQAQVGSASPAMRFTRNRARLSFARTPGSQCRKTVSCSSSRAPSSSVVAPRPAARPSTARTSRASALAVIPCAPESQWASSSAVATRAIKRAFVHESEPSRNAASHSGSCAKAVSMRARSCTCRAESPARSTP